MRDRRSSGKHLVILLFLGGVEWSDAALGENWPAWRGDGSGVSRSNDLPESWGPKENVRWKARIPGKGISSPIVWGNRVFLTSAIEGKEAVFERWVLVALVVSLLAIAWLLIAIGFLKKVRPTTGSSPLQRAVETIDRIGTVCVSVLFVGAALAVVFKIDAPLFRRLQFQLGDVERAYRATGIVAAVGVVSAIGWLRIGSRSRLVAGLLSLCAAVFYHIAAPLDMFNWKIPWHKLLLASGPLSLAGFWTVSLSFSFHRERHKFEANPWFLSAAGLLATVAVVEFVAFNWRPGTTLWRSIVCLARDSGEILWRTDCFGAPAGRKHRTNSYATPTPVTDGAFVVADFGRKLMCVNFDGRIMWVRPVPAYGEHLRYGAGLSPVIFRDRLIHAYMPEWPGDDARGEENAVHAAYVAALDIETGSVLWSVQPPGAHDSYNTPFLHTGREPPLLLFGTWGHVVAYDPRNGALVWSCRVPIEQCCPSIVADGERCYMLGGAGNYKKSGVAIRLDVGDVTDLNVVWNIRRGLPDASSPVLYDGLLYFVSNVGVVSCVEAKTGETVWKNRVGGRYWSSLVAGDGKVYLVAEDGRTVVLRAGREFVKIAENDLAEGCLASPALCDGQIFLRTRSHLYCIEQKGNNRGGE